MRELKILNQITGFIIIAIGVVGFLLGLLKIGSL
jgi:preprotein translocase subunit Sss1